MSKNVIVSLLILVVIAGAAVIAVGSRSNETSTPATSDTSMNEKTMSEENTPSEQASPSEAAAADSVTIQNFAFTPATIKVKAGTTVTWRNQDSTMHNVIADNPSADAPSGPLLGKGETYKFTFNKVGTYAYHCGPHPNMKGTVIVE